MKPIIKTVTISIEIILRPLYIDIKNNEAGVFHFVLQSMLTEYSFLESF